MNLPEIIKDRMDMEINDQLSITLFPEDEGQPKCDIISVNFTEIEGKKTSLYLTPCEAMEIASALNTAVQFYLYNQEQYRKDILEPRITLANERGAPECASSLDSSDIVEESPEEILAIMEEDVEDSSSTDFDAEL
jgi:hypothetical protein